MLEDEHFKVMEYYADASTVFPGTDIKGGVAVSYRDAGRDFGAVKVFTKFEELNQILQKTRLSSGYKGMDCIAISRTVYRLTDCLHRDFPFAHYAEDDSGENIGRLSKGHDYDMSTNIFDCLPEVFYDDQPDDGEQYVRILGRADNNRCYKYIKAKYVNDPEPLHSYSIILPKASGTGEFGEILSQPVLTAPGTGSTESFLSIGCFKSENEGENCLKYISTKFARAMLGVLKITQDLTPKKWAYVPLQDFTSSSDIDWSRSIPEIDQQLYAKYGLNENEIAFIESHVKEMS